MMKMITLNDVRREITENFDVKVSDIDDLDGVVFIALTVNLWQWFTTDVTAREVGDFLYERGPVGIAWHVYLTWRWPWQ